MHYSRKKKAGLEARIFFISPSEVMRVQLKLPSIVDRHTGETPSWIPLSFALLALLVIGMVGFSFKKGLEMITEYAPLLNADTEIKLNVSIAHMWVEEILGGETTKKTGDVWRMLDRADWYALAMLEGGKNKERTIIPLQDPETRRIVKKVVQELKEFRSIAERRFAHRETSRAGSPIDHHYDKVYSAFTQNADLIKFRLQELIATDLKYFKVTQYTLMTVCFFVSVIAGTSLYRFELFRNRVIQALHQSNENLEKEIEERILAEDRLIESKEQLRRLGHQLQTAREEEKAKIAREVHDELGQTLTALKMELSCLNHDLKENPEQTPDRINAMSELIDNTIKSVQRIATELRPQILDVLGLAEAIRWETSEFEKRTGIDCQLQLPPSKIEMNREINTAVFRIYQETMTNIARHSKADRVQINLQADAQQVTLEIQDNGRGISSHEIYNKNSLGLLGIHERAHYLNGEFEIIGDPTTGTQVRVSIPLEEHGLSKK